MIKAVCAAGKSGAVTIRWRRVDFPLPGNPVMSESESGAVR